MRGKFRMCIGCGNTLPLDHEDDLCEKCSEPSLEERVEALEQIVDELRSLLNI